MDCNNCQSVKDFYKRIDEIMNAECEMFSVHYKMISRCILKCTSSCNSVQKLSREYKLSAIQTEAKWRATNNLAKYSANSSVSISTKTERLIRSTVFLSPTMQTGR